MPDAVAWDILNAVQDELQTMQAAGNFAPMGGERVKEIQSNSIVIRKLIRGRRQDERKQLGVSKPAILIGYSGSVTPADEGENCTDDTTYTIVIQIIDDDNKTRNAYLRTYLKWAQNVRRAFHNKALAAVMTDEGRVNIAAAEEVDNLDERVWIRDGDMVAAVEAKFLSRGTRAIT